MIDKFSILNGTTYFSLGIFQIYLVLMSTKKYIKYFLLAALGLNHGNLMGVHKKELNIELSKTAILYQPDHHLLPDMNFKVQRLIKNKISFPKHLINLYISYTPSRQLGKLKTNFILCNCLFGSPKLTKNANLDKYKYTGYSIGFYSRSELLFPYVSYGKNAIWS